MADNKNESLILGMTEPEILTKIRALVDTKRYKYPSLNREDSNNMIYNEKYPMNLLAAIQRNLYWHIEDLDAFDKYFTKYGIMDGLDALIELIGKKNGNFINAYFKNENERATIDKLEELAIFPNAISKAINQSDEKLSKALISQSKFISDDKVAKENNEEEIDLD